MGGNTSIPTVDKQDIETGLKRSQDNKEANKEVIPFDSPVDVKGLFPDNEHELLCHDVIVHGIIPFFELTRVNPEFVTILYNEIKGSSRCQHFVLRDFFGYFGKDETRKVYPLNWGVCFETFRKKGLYGKSQNEEIYIPPEQVMPMVKNLRLFGEISHINIVKQTELLSKFSGLRSFVLHEHIETIGSTFQYQCLQPFSFDVKCLPTTLRELRASFSGVNDPNWAERTARFPHLEVLQTEISNNLVRGVKNFPKLRSLVIQVKYTHNLFDNVFENNKELRKLHILHGYTTYGKWLSRQEIYPSQKRWVMGIYSKGLENFSRHLTNLRELKLQGAKFRFSFSKFMRVVSNSVIDSLILKDAKIISTSIKRLTWGSNVKLRRLELDICLGAISLLVPLYKDYFTKDEKRGRMKSSFATGFFKSLQNTPLRALHITCFEPDVADVDEECYTYFRTHLDEFRFKNRKLNEEDDDPVILTSVTPMHQVKKILYVEDQKPPRKEGGGVQEMKVFKKGIAQCDFSYMSIEDEKRVGSSSKKKKEVQMVKEGDIVFVISQLGNTSYRIGNSMGKEQYVEKKFIKILEETEY